MVSCNAQAWALANFGGTDLGDRRREKRLTKMAAAMADAPDGSLPKQCGKWGDVKAAYRLLNHPEIEPQQLTGVHRQSVRDQARQLPVVLCVQDTTDLDFTHRSAVKGLGKIGDGGGRGFRQHTGLAVSEHGDVLGVLEQKWFVPVEPEEGETRRGRQARWSEPDVWGDIAEGIGPWPAPSRLIHVCDRHGDVFRFVCTCRRLGHGFIVRAMHDRYLSDGERLWEELRSQPPAYIDTVKAGAQRTKGNKVKRSARTARVTVRYKCVLLPPPRNDPRTAKEAPVRAWAIYVLEEDPPSGEEALEWMLLTSEPVDSDADAKRCVRWYTYRWHIEEWHRALKEGCRIEDSQLDDVRDLERLAALKGVIAVRMLQLRDLANSDAPEANSPVVLQRTVPTIWIEVVSRLGRLPAETLTPREFLLAIARRGGYLGRKHDGRPGWKVIWRGWYDVERLVEGAELMRPP